MDPLLSTLVLILLALLGARFSFATFSVTPGPRLVFRTGTHFLFVGFLLGPGALNLLGQEAIQQLFPLMALGLGWVGFLFGLQLDRDSLSQFPWSFHAFAVGQAVITYGAFLAIGQGLLTAAGLGGEVPALLLLAAAATACITTPAGIALISTNFLVRGPVRRLLFYVASVDAAVGIVALQVAYALFHPAELVLGLAQVTALGWLVVATGLGIICGILFLWLTRRRVDPDELVLFLLGIAAFASGAALHLQLSPLFVSGVMGVVVANLSPDRQRVFEALRRWEKPVYVVLLLLAGALLRFPTLWILPLAGAYALLRAVGKVAGSAVMAGALPLDFRMPRRGGLGLLPQGGISMAMAVGGVLIYQGLGLGEMSAVEILFGIIVLGVVLSELMGPFFTTRVLRAAGEISPRVEEALARGDERTAQEEAARHVPESVEGGEGPPEKDSQE